MSTLFKFILVNLILSFQLAFAGGGLPLAQVVYDPWNEVHNSMTAANSITQIVNQAQQLQYELNNFKNYDGNVTKWSEALGLLQKLGDVTAQGNAISYSMQNVNDAFQQKYPGYKPQQDYDKAYQGWSATTMSTIGNTFQSAGMQANDFATEQQRIDQLKVLSSTASGRMQAVQVGNMIASEQVGQMQKLRQLVMSQSDSQNAYMAYNVQKDQAQQAAENNLFKNPIPYPKYGSGAGFGSSSLPKLTN